MYIKCILHVSITAFIESMVHFCIIYYMCVILTYLLQLHFVENPDNINNRYDNTLCYMF